MLTIYTGRYLHAFCWAAYHVPCRLLAVHQTTAIIVDDFYPQKSRWKFTHESNNSTQRPQTIAFWSSKIHVQIHLESMFCGQEVRQIKRGDARRKFWIPNLAIKWQKLIRGVIFLDCGAELLPRLILCTRQLATERF